MPDDCGLKPPIETLPQIGARAGHVVSSDGRIARWTRGRAGQAGHERGGTIAHGLRPPARSRQLEPVRTAARRTRPRARADPIPGRSLATPPRHRDIVRTAVLGVYGVSASRATDRSARLVDRLGLGRPGIGLSTGPRARDRPPPDRRLRAAGRRGRPPGRFGRPLRRPARARPRGRPLVDPRRRPPVEPRRHRRRRSPSHPARDRRAARPRRQRHGRRLMARRDLRRQRAARRLPAARSRTSRPTSTRSTPSTSSRSPTATPARTCWRPSAAALDEAEASAASAGRARRGGGQLRGADGRPRQLRRDHEPDPRAGSPRASPARSGSTASTSPTPSTRAPRPPTGPWRSRSRARSSRSSASRRPPRSRPPSGTTDVETVLAATVEAAERSVARTPTLLPILREARRRRLGRPGPVPPVPGRARRGAWPRRHGADGGGAAGRAGTAAAAGSAPAVRHGRRRARGRGLRLRDHVPPPGRPPATSLDVDAIQRAPRGDGRVACWSPAARAREGPRPQRAARPGHRLRPDARDR